MEPADLEAVLRRHRREPPAALRARVIAAAAAVERQPPWWARTRTWAVAAALLLVVDAVVMQADPPSPGPATASAMTASVDDPPCPTLCAEVRPAPIAWGPASTFHDLAPQDQP
jgi:hypothetical protein